MHFLSRPFHCIVSFSSQLAFPQHEGLSACLPSHCGPVEHWLQGNGGVHGHGGTGPGFARSNARVRCEFSRSLSVLQSAFELTTFQRSCLIDTIEASPCLLTNTTCSCSNSTISDLVELCVLANCTVKQQLSKSAACLYDGPRSMLKIKQRLRTSRRRCVKRQSETRQLPHITLESSEASLLCSHIRSEWFQECPALVVD